MPSNNDFLTLKYSSAGALLWARTYDAGSWEFAKDVAVDGSGNAYLTGGNGSHEGYPDFFVIKYDPQGTFLWEKSPSPESRQARRAFCDMTTDGGGYTLCAAHGHGASGDGLGYLTASWGEDAGPFLAGGEVVAHGSFCGALTMSRVFAAHFTDATTERFRTAPIPTGGENPFAEPLGRHRYEDGPNVLGVIAKDAMAKWVLSGTACLDEDNGPPQGSAICFSDGARWQLVVGNLNNYQYSGEMEWMCQPNAFCGWPTGSESVLVFAR